jgi:hypothetical protein
MQVMLPLMMLTALSLAACNSGDEPASGEAATKAAPAPNLAVAEAPDVDAVSLQKIISEKPAEVAVTIYPDDLALITEKRIVTVPAGRSTIAFAGVSDRMIPQTALLREFGPITIERNFDYDLLTPASLYEAAIGKEVIITRTNRRTGSVSRDRAKIVSAEQGMVLEIDGRYEAFKCAGTAEKLELASLPENLKAEPTLSIDIQAEEAGEQELTISYLASGFNWQADYILNLQEGGKTAAMTGWLTLVNGTAISFANAPTAIVAGELQRTGDTYADRIYPEGFYYNCWPVQTTKAWTEPPRPEMVAAPSPSMEYRQFKSAGPMEAEEMMADSVVVTGSRIAEEEDLGDYKLYNTPEPTTVAAYQTKQIAFLDKPDVELEKFYIFDVYEPYDQGSTLKQATVEYRLDNSREGNLSQSLPRGTVRVMDKRKNGSSFYLGEGDIKDLAIDLPVKVKTSTATDVQMQMRVLDEQYFEINDVDYVRRRMEHVFYNALNEPVQVELAIDYYAPVKTSAWSARLVPDEPVPTWRLTLPPQGQRTLTYTAEFQQ